MQFCRLIAGATLLCFSGTHVASAQPFAVPDLGKLAPTQRSIVTQ